MLGSVTKIIIFIESEAAELEEGGAWLWRVASDLGCRDADFVEILNN